MNTRAPEPRNFWGLTKQIGPWKTTSVDQTHLAQGYDSPHNNRQFVTPYQQDGTATIPDQAYTALSIIEPSSEKEFRDGRVRKVKTGIGFSGLGFQSIDNPHRVLPESQDIEMAANPPDTPITRATTNLILSTQEFAKKVRARDVRAGAMDLDEIDSSNVKPRLESDFLTTNNTVVQSINQVVKTERDDFRTMVATNAWTQPATQVATSERASSRPVVKAEIGGDGTRGQLGQPAPKFSRSNRPLDIGTSQVAVDAINAMLRANRP